MGNEEWLRYASLLLQIRLLADEYGDNRSLVAIAAQFERDADDLLATLRRSIIAKSHNRNAA
jgi:hypothetical protein